MGGNVRSSVVLLLFHRISEVQAPEGVPAHERDIFNGRTANPDGEARDGRCRDVNY